MAPKPFHKGLFTASGVAILSLASAGTLAGQQILLESGSGAALVNLSNRDVIEGSGGTIEGLDLSGNWLEKRFVDLNGDGNNDLLLRSSTGSWMAYLLDAGEILESGSLGITANTAWELKGSADYNGDGNADVILRNSASGTWFVYLLSGLSVPASGAVNLAFNQDWKYQGTADFNGDGKSDVLLRHQNNNSWFLYAMDGVGLNSADTGLIRFALNPDWSFVAADDFTGDGKADMIMRRNDGPWWMYQADGTEVLLNENFGLLALTANTTWAFQGTGDFNGDQRADVLLRNSANHNWFVYALDGRAKVDADVGGVDIGSDAGLSFLGLGDYSQSAFEYYQQNISDIVQESCLACHVEQGVAGSTALVYQPASVENYQSNNYELIKRFVEASSGGADSLKDKASGMGHGGGEQLPLGSDGYLALEQFLELLEDEPAANTGVFGQSKWGDGSTYK